MIKKITDKTEIYKMNKFLGGKDNEVFVGRRERNNKNETWVCRAKFRRFEVTLWQLKNEHGFSYLVCLQTRMTTSISSDLEL